MCRVGVCAAVAGHRRDGTVAPLGARVGAIARVGGKNGRAKFGVDFLIRDPGFQLRPAAKIGGGLREDLHSALDWDLLLRFRQAGARFVRVPRFLGAWL